MPIKKEEATPDTEPVAGTVAAMEAAIVAMAKSKAAAKPKAPTKVGADAAAHVMQRPSGAHVQKRPAGKEQAPTVHLEIDMRDVYDKLRKLRKREISRAAFMTRAYQQGRKRASDQGADDDDARIYGRIEHKKAAYLYSKIRP